MILGIELRYIRRPTQYQVSSWGTCVPTRYQVSNWGIFSPNSILSIELRPLRGRTRCQVSSWEHSFERKAKSSVPIRVFFLELDCSCFLEAVALMDADVVLLRVAACGFSVAHRFCRSMCSPLSCCVLSRSPLSRCVLSCALSNEKQDKACCIYRAQIIR